MKIIFLPLAKRSTNACHAIYFWAIHQFSALSFSVIIIIIVNYYTKNESFSPRLRRQRLFTRYDAVVEAMLPPTNNIECLSIPLLSD